MRSAMLLLLATVALGAAGCRTDPDPDRWVGLGALPYVMLNGAPHDVKPGRGVELTFARLVPADLPIPLGWSARLAWSHHAGEGGRADAEYLRASLGPTLRLLRPTGPGARSYWGLLVTFGGSVHWLVAEQGTDVAGFGLTLEPELRWQFGARGFVGAALTLEGWLHTRGGVAGGMAAALRAGWSF